MENELTCIFPFCFISLVVRELCSFFGLMHWDIMRFLSKISRALVFGQLIGDDE